MWPSLSESVSILCYILSSAREKTKGTKQNYKETWIDLRYTGKNPNGFHGCESYVPSQAPSLLPTSLVPCRLPWKCQSFLRGHHTTRWTSCTLLSDFPSHLQPGMQGPTKHDTNMETGHQGGQVMPCYFQQG